jgi:GNAT superfamily N-acetyltransferase
VAKEKDKVLGYVCGCPRTQGNVLMLQNHLMSFLDELQRFPAHLHINCHRDSRGMGIGRMLVEAFCKKLDSKGVHIITTKDSENTKFYQALGFDYNKQEGSFYFMGKTL